MLGYGNSAFSSNPDVVDGAAVTDGSARENPLLGLAQGVRRLAKNLVEIETVRGQPWLGRQELLNSVAADLEEFPAR